MNWNPVPYKLTCKIIPLHWQTSYSSLGHYPEQDYTYLQELEALKVRFNADAKSF